MTPDNITEYTNASKYSRFMKIAFPDNSYSDVKFKPAIITNIYVSERKRTDIERSLLHEEQIDDACKYIHEAFENILENKLINIDRIDDFKKLKRKINFIETADGFVEIVVQALSLLE